MFELADRLGGIYKTNDATKSVTINPKQLTVAAKAVKAAPGPALALALGFGDAVVGGSCIDCAVVGVIFVASVVGVRVVFVVFRV